MSAERRVIGWITLSIDGFSAGPDGDMSWLVEHAIDEDAAAYYEGVYSGVSTALLGRTNYEGFAGYWPPVATDESVDPRTRRLAQWLNEVELDDLRITVLPAVLGSGLRFFPDGLPASRWRLAGTSTFATGGVALHYRRA